uniref:Uncharacterized protein n=1 Tax=Chenopodium quinoa TaxID=63459 RepID=A0A803N6K0_CHEQI
MDALLTQVVISFRHVLKQITRCLNFLDPEYQYLNVRRSIACVVVRSDNGVVPTIYLGGDTVSVEESCEIAARKVVYDLVKIYKIAIEDVTALQKQMYERCGRSKQNLARKVVDYLIDACNLEIVNVNYRATTCLVEQDCIAPVRKEFQVPVPIPPVITFNKTDIRSQVVKSSAITNFGSEVFPEVAGSEDLHGRFKRIRFLAAVCLLSALVLLSWFCTATAVLLVSWSHDIKVALENGYTQLVLGSCTSTIARPVLSATVKKGIWMHNGEIGKIDDLPFHLALGSKTVIRSLDPKVESVYPRYQSLASILSIPVDDERHDILVIVLYVLEEPRKIVTSSNKETSVRDFMVIDHWYLQLQPIKVCTWNDLAGEQYETTVSDSESFKVIGITALRPITCQGFSLESTMSAFIMKDPKGDKAEALAEWATITFNVSDGTGELELTAFTEVCNKLFG